MGELGKAVNLLKESIDITDSHAVSNTADLSISKAYLLLDKPILASRILRLDLNGKIMAMKIDK